MAKVQLENYPSEDGIYEDIWVDIDIEDFNNEPVKESASDCYMFYLKDDVNPKWTEIFKTDRVVYGCAIWTFEESPEEFEFCIQVDIEDGEILEGLLVVYYCHWDDELTAYFNLDIDDELLVNYLTKDL